MLRRVTELVTMGKAMVTQLSRKDEGYKSGKGRRLRSTLRVLGCAARSRKTSLISRIGDLSISPACCLDRPKNKLGQIASQIILTEWLIIPPRQGTQEYPVL